MLYVPPETGYKTHYSITVPKGQKKETYLYIKSRDGQVYSRLDVKFAAAVGNEKILWVAKVETNPLGERNLDYDSDRFKEYLRQKLANREKMGP